MTRQVDERFWEKVTKTSGCWLWSKCLDKRGYGRFHFNGENKLAHRVAYFLAYGIDVPELDHQCRVHNCVRPEHLKPVTSAENKQNFPDLIASNTSGYRGVTWDRSRGKWVAQAQHHGRCYTFGRFDSKEDAVRAAREGRLKLFTNNLSDRGIVL